MHWCVFPCLNTWELGMLQSYHLRHLSRLKIHTYKCVYLHCHYYSANKYTVCMEMNTERSHPAYPAHDSQLWYVTSRAGALWTSRSFKRGVDSRRRPAGSLADRECFITTETRFNCISDFSDAVNPSVTHSKVPIHTKEDSWGWPSLGDKAWHRCSVGWRSGLCAGTIKVFYTSL